LLLLLVLILLLSRSLHLWRFVIVFLFQNSGSLLENWLKLFALFNLALASRLFLLDRTHFFDCWQVLLVILIKLLSWWWTLELLSLEILLVLLRHKRFLSNYFLFWLWNSWRFRLTKRSLSVKFLFWRRNLDFLSRKATIWCLNTWILWMNFLLNHFLSNWYINLLTIFLIIVL
jgi:hypothetical protein